MKGGGVVVEKTDKAYDGNVLGIVSTNPAIKLGDWRDQDPAKLRPVALSGRIPVKIATDSAAIQPGDYITSSSTPGRAMKATQAGATIGKALESWTPDSGKDTILVFANLSYRTDALLVSEQLPGLTFDYVNKHIIDSIAEHEASTSAQLSTLTSNVASLAARINYLEDTVVLGEHSEGIIVDSTTEATPGQLNERIATSSSFMNLKDTFASRMDNLSNRLSFLEMQASTSALLNNAPGNFTASSGAELGLDKLDINDATIDKTLTVLGRTLLSDVGITGKLTMGLLSISGLDDDGGSSINTATGALKLQSNGLNSLDILNGKVIVEASGNVTIQEALSAKTVSTTKLNIIPDPKAADSTQPSNSAGSVTIPAGQTAVTVTTTALTPKSLLFATPDSPITVGAKAKDTDTFTIKLQSAQSTAVKVNWWIVN